MRIAIDARYIQDHFPGIGRYTYNLIAALAEARSDDTLIVVRNPRLPTTRFDLAALAQQYWRYGFWKARMLRRYPETVRWRQALPPLFVLSLLFLAALAMILPVAGWIFVLELVIYGLMMLFVGIQQGIKRRDPALIIGVPLAIVVMHISWGSAFLWSIIFR